MLYSKKEKLGDWPEMTKCYVEMCTLHMILEEVPSPLHTSKMEDGLLLSQDISIKCMNTGKQLRVMRMVKASLIFYRVHVLLHHVSGHSFGSMKNPNIAFMIKLWFTSLMLISNKVKNLQRATALAITPCQRASLKPEYVIEKVHPPQCSDCSSRQGKIWKVTILVSGLAATSVGGNSKSLSMQWTNGVQAL